MHRYGTMWLAGCAAVILALVSGCGAHPAAPPRTAPSAECEVNPTAAPSEDCLATELQRDQQSNQMFNERRTLPSWRVAQAQPVTARIQQSLQRLTPAQRVQADTVRSTLVAAGMDSDGLVLEPFKQAGVPDGVEFGGLEQFSAAPVVCAYGEVTVQQVEVDMGGNTLEGGCLESAGGH